MAPQTAHSQAKMKAAATKINDTAGKISEVQRDLRSHQAELTGHWKGQGANAFMSVFQQFDAEFTQVLRELNVIHEKLVHTQTKYAATEQQAAGDIGRLGGIINA